MRYSIEQIAGKFYVRDSAIDILQPRKDTKAECEAWIFDRLEQDAPKKELRLVDCKDEELANALHFLEGMEDNMETEDTDRWVGIKQEILRIVESAREMI